MNIGMYKPEDYEAQITNKQTITNQQQLSRRPDCNS